MRLTGLFLVLIIPVCLFGQEKKVSEFDRYVQQGVQDWQVPGLSIAVVKDGEVLFRNGYGVTDITSQNPSTTKSRYMIGSTTKAMTAVGLAIMVDEGKLGWDDKVTDYLPEFSLYDPYVTREITITDLLTHRAGLGNADFLWSVNDIDSDEILDRLRYLEPTYSFRDGYTYQNIMYLAAGKVLERVSGLSWAEFMEKRLFEPLEMTGARALYEQIEDEKDYALPHYMVEDEIEIIPFLTADKIGPAGSIWASIEDMSNWMLMLLDSGRFQGKTIVTPERIKEIWDSYNMVPPGHFYPTAKLTKPNWTTYGLGWFQHDYQGYQLQFHTGSLPGLTAIIGLIPEENFGVYAFGNLDHAELRHALMYKAIDHFLELGNRDWSKEFKKLYDGLAQQNQESQNEAFSNQVSGTAPSLSLTDYVGKYSSPLYGEIEVSKEKEWLIVTFSEGKSAKLKHWHYDTFFGEWEMAYSTPDLFQFHLNPDGSAGSLEFSIFSFRKD